MATLRIQTLGPFRIWRHDEPVADTAWPTAKSKTLFKILLTERGRYVPTDRLLEYLWPDLSPRKALNNLWVTISHVRRTLEPELAPRTASAYINTTHDGYTFNQASDYWLDVDTFSMRLRSAQTISDLQRRIEALEAVRALYQGPYLEEDPYEEWTLSIRATLHADYLSLLADLADSYGRQGQYQHAIAICGEILAHERSRELIYRQLMLYHYCAGDQRQALKVFEDCRRALDEELGVAPMSETTELYRKIQRREVENVDHSALYPVPVSHIATPYSLSRVPFVGREREYTQLLGLVSEAVARRGHVVLVEGEPGIGKSRLVQETMGYARQHGLTTLLTNCYQIEQTMPYQPVVDLATHILNEWPAVTFRTLAPVSLAEIAALVPAVRNHFPQLPSPPVDFPEARQARLFKALVQLVDAITHAGKPILLAVDDIHWSDTATLQFLHHLGRHVSDRPVLLLCTFRGEAVEEDERLSTFVHSIKRDSSTHHIALRRLSATDAQTLLAQLANSALHTSELSAWLHLETDGNPFFLVSILQSLLEQGLLTANGEDAWQVKPATLYTAATAVRLPEALRESVRDRLRRVPQAMRRILDVAAVLDRHCDFPMLRAATHEREEALLDALETLVQRQLLREAGDGQFEFSHDKVRDVVYHDLSGTRRVLLHRVIGETLEAAMSEQAAERAVTLAEHFDRGQVWGKALVYLAQAADRAQHLFAMREALGFFDRAVALVEAHPDATDHRMMLHLYEHRGEARAQAGAIEGAVADLSHVLNAVRQRGDHALECDLLIKLGMVYRRGDDYERATSYLSDALNVLRAAGDDHRIADTLYHLGTVAWSAGFNRQAMVYHQEAVAICHRLQFSDLVAVQAFHGRGEAYFAAAQPQAAIACYATSLAFARAIGDKSYEAENLMMIGYAHTGYMGTGEYHQARAHFEAAHAICEASELRWHAGPTALGLGYIHGCTGDYQLAWNILTDTLQRLESLQLRRYQIMAYDFLGCLLQDLNLLEQATLFHQQGLDLARKTNILFWGPRLQANLAIDELRLGRLDVALTLQRALATAQTNGQEYLVLRCLEGLAELALASGEPQKTLQYADELLRLATSGGLAEMVAQAHRWRGEALFADGDFHRAESELHLAEQWASANGRLRLVWDVAATQIKLYQVVGQAASVVARRAVVQKIVSHIVTRVHEPTLRAGLPNMEV